MSLAINYINYTERRQAFDSIYCQYFTLIERSFDDVHTDVIWL
jgi:hypothetical protein